MVERRWARLLRLRPPSELASVFGHFLNVVGSLDAVRKPSPKEQTMLASIQPRTRYKVWVEVEEITTNSHELHCVRDPEPVEVGHFSNRAEAEHLMASLAAWRGFDSHVPQDKPTG